MWIYIAHCHEVFMCCAWSQSCEANTRWKASGRRSPGRLKKRWMDYVEEDLLRAEISIHGITTGRWWVSLQEIAEDRSQWRGLVMASVAKTICMMTVWPDLRWLILSCLMWAVMSVGECVVAGCGASHSSRGFHTFKVDAFVKYVAACSVNSSEWISF